MTSENPLNLIVEVLKKNPEGLTLFSLAELSGLHRHTVSKYVNELMNSGIVFQRNVGVAKLCFLKEKVEIQTDENPTDTPTEGITNKRSQIKIIAAVVLLTLLLSETAIFAYQNTSLFNETNLSDFTSINTSPLTESITPNTSPMTESISNISPDENIILNITSDSTEKNDSVDNLTVEILNETIEQINESLQGNQTIIEPVLNYSNQTNETQETPQKTPANLEINLDYPRKITRGEIITAKVTVINIDSSTAQNVVLTWKIPSGFELVSGQENEICGTLEPASTCFSEINLKTDASTVLGMNEIKVVVSYE